LRAARITAANRQRRTKGLPVASQQARNPALLGLGRLLVGVRGVPILLGRLAMRLCPLRQAMLVEQLGGLLVSFGRPCPTAGTRPRADQASVTVRVMPPLEAVLPTSLSSVAGADWVVGGADSVTPSVGGGEPFPGGGVAGAHPASRAAEAARRTRIGARMR
jgi:hypothetical protein